MRDQEKGTKSEEKDLSYGGGDLKKRFEEFGNKVRKQCLTYKSRSNSNVDESQFNSQVEIFPTEDKYSGIVISQKFIDIMYYGSPEDQMKGVKFIRKLLSSPQPPIDDVLQAGLLPILVQLMKSKSDLMQYEAAWSLTNVLSGSSMHVRYVIEAGAVPSFIRLLSSSSEDVQEQSAWAIGNIAGDMDDFRVYILEKGAMYSLLEMMESTAYLKLLQTGAWAVCNMCVNNKDFKSISIAIPVLGRFLSHDDTDFIYNCTLALVHLSDGEERLELIVKNNIVPSVIKLLTGDKECIMPQLLKILVNVSLGKEFAINNLMECGVLHALMRFLDSAKESFRYKSTCIVANMALGNPHHIDYIINDKTTISKILSSIGKETDRIVKQAVYTLRNISRRGSLEQILRLTEKCVINKLCYALSSYNASIVFGALLCLERLLAVREQKVEEEGAYNEVALTIEECGGLEKIEELQSHGNHDIYHKAYEIMEQYFTTEELSFTERPNF
ncbi:importin subunit alpha-5 [Halyomorpha halys]|uniref:importin subunit alpha-5 n=1 Tax=Halyomorpha halys TaxID=286706 RepID=UPI0006D522B0|nr:importin subunit alpha-5-like [Halyomorpha halys]